MHVDVYEQANLQGDVQNIMDSYAKGLEGQEMESRVKFNIVVANELNDNDNVNFINLNENNNNSNNIIINKSEDIELLKTDSN